MDNRKEVAGLEDKVTKLMDLWNSVSLKVSRAFAHHRKCDSHSRQQPSLTGNILNTHQNMRVITNECL